MITKDGLNNRIEKLSPAKRELLQRRLQGIGSGERGTQRIPRRPEHLSVPLSYAQKRLWFHAKTEPDSRAYNIVRALKIDGKLNLPALVKAFIELGRRHESLRTVFQIFDNEPVQIVRPDLELTLHLIDLRSLSEPQRSLEMHRVVYWQAGASFDFEHEPSLRCALILLDGERHVLSLILHHIICDGWSLDLLFRDLSTLYRSILSGERVSLPALSIQYADYAYWQRQMLDADVMRECLEYWKQKLFGAPSLLELPLDKPRQRLQSFKGAVETFSVDAGATKALKAISSNKGTTLFVTLLAIFNAFINRYTGQSDIVIGTVISNRDHIETENLIGMFADTLVLRTDLSGEPSFLDLVERTKETVVGAFMHQDLPFEKIVEALQTERTLSYSPIFQILFVLNKAVNNVADEKRIAFDVMDISADSTPFDLVLTMTDENVSIIGSLQYKTDLFDQRTIIRMISRFQTLLRQLVEQPQLPIGNAILIDQQEREQLLYSYNNTRADYPQNVTIPEMFEQQAAVTPTATAFLCEQDRIDCEQLNARANQLARYLRCKGVKPETLVGINTHRNIECMIALLATLKAGAAYLHLDPAYPKPRLEAVLTELSPQIILTQQRYIESLPKTLAEVINIDGDWDEIGKQSRANLEKIAKPDNPAYVMTTSGSTGRPKGVVGLHRGAINRFAWMWQTYPFEQAEVCCQKTSLGFVDSVWELFGPLLKGVTSVIIPDEQVKDPRELICTLSQHKVSRIVVVPSLLVAILDSEEEIASKLPTLKTWVVSGEALSSGLAKKFGEKLPEARLLNLYGMSEASADASYWEVRRECVERETTLIGEPISNTAIYILDNRMMPAGIGMRGEIYISGEGLSRGYYNKPEMTAERFVPNPYGKERGARMYRTGDLGRYKEDGKIEYLGREDEQVSLRGYRVEPAEIEAALMEHGSVRQAAVIVKGESVDKRLVAYAVADPSVSGGELRSYLKQRLPDHMVPASVSCLKEMPFTASGKVNRKTLLDSSEMHEELIVGRTLARTPIEEVLANIWAEVLNTNAPGIDDNFFDLGGHSLLATRIVLCVRERLDVDISHRSIFEAPTIKRLSETIEKALRVGHVRRIPGITKADRNADLPLSFAQERLWFIDQLQPGNTAYNVAKAVRLQGPLSLWALSETVNRIMHRHEVLRTTFEFKAGRPVQVIQPPSHLCIPVIDLSELSDNAKEEEARRLGEEESNKAFDLSKGPMVRLKVVRQGGHEHVIIYCMHHIVTDGWSMELMMEEMKSLYESYSRGENNVQQEEVEEIQYADYAVWQREWMRGEIMEEGMSYWKKQLSGELQELKLPTDRPRPERATGRRGALTTRMQSDLLEQLRELSRREGVTLFMTLLAAFKALLYTYTHQNDMVVGVPIANRSRPEIEKLIGFFVNMLVIRTDLSGIPRFRELLRRVRVAILGAYMYQDIPFDKIVSELRLERKSGKFPIFNTTIVNNRFQENNTTVTSVKAIPFEIEHESGDYDLLLWIAESSESLSIKWTYNADLFDAETVERMIDRFEVLLVKIASNLDERIDALKISTEADRLKKLEWEQQKGRVLTEKLMTASRRPINLSRVTDNLE